MESKLIPYIQALFPQPEDAPVPNGDDATVVSTTDRTAVTVDTQIENVHFQWAWGTPGQLGARLVGVVLSDLAAMGARPRHGVLSLMVPPGYPLVRVKAWLRGVRQRSLQEGFSIVGGDVTNAQAFGAVLTAFGEAPARPLQRNGASPGELLCVTGPIGEPSWELASLLAGRRKQARRWLVPPSRVGLGQALAANERVTAAMDISDGLFIDARRLARASGVGVCIDLDRIPRTSPVVRALKGLTREAQMKLLGGGEDYELLVAVKPDGAIPEGLIPIGHITSKNMLISSGDHRFSWPSAGYLHR